MIRLVARIALAVASVGVLVAVYFFWLVIPVAGILLYAILQYAFRRRRRNTVLDFRLAHEAEARRTDIRRSTRA